MKEKLLKQIWHFWSKMLHKRNTPEEIAGGVAVGLFFAFVGPPGTQLLLALSVGSVLRCNLIAAAAATFVSNPLTMPFLYPLAAWLGSLITDVPIRDSVPLTDEGFWAYATNFRAHGRIVVLILVGCLALGSISAFGGYYIVKTLMTSYYKRLGAKTPRPSE